MAYCTISICSSKRFKITPTVLWLPFRFEHHPQEQPEYRNHPLFPLSHPRLGRIPMLTMPLERIVKIQISYGTRDMYLPKIPKAKSVHAAA